MITLRKAAERGHAHHGWLDSWHSFSFADYHDPEHVHFGPLRVINEDRIVPGSGFGQHGHRDMEIISYVLEGALAHKDSMGNAASIVPGEVQRMSAGSGVLHSEYNHDPVGTTHFLQIWIIPERRGGAPGYEQKAFPEAEKRGRLRLVASPDGADGSVRLQQDARMYAGLFDGSEEGIYRFAPGRLGYLHVARGRIEANGQLLEAGDAMKLVDEAALQLARGQDAEVLLFDLPPG
ncbi:pirin family protein [Pseudomarimonas salicorniae]|uniref:Pirin family protein n=1 Tax=Pseudomarimonas salicorniae TaxID=2933270 RepID=A0ABT0GM21_9GAMM|nr:pirin family protein [Lysobacter sp. CAU 1642]MCK7595593.1 pirin family protein [Lysobacter sp. CAU 1642]